jgi:hypothetical protein
MRKIRLAASMQLANEPSLSLENQDLQLNEASDKQRGSILKLKMHLDSKEVCLQDLMDEANGEE